MSDKEWAFTLACRIIQEDMKNIDITRWDGELVAIAILEKALTELKEELCNKQ